MEKIVDRKRLGEKNATLASQHVGSASSVPPQDGTTFGRAVMHGTAVAGVVVCGTTIHGTAAAGEVVCGASVGCVPVGDTSVDGTWCIGRKYP